MSDPECARMLAVAFRYEGVVADRDPLPRDAAVAVAESLLTEVRGALAAVEGG